MNSDQTRGNWQQISGYLTKKWGKLTGDDLAQVKGDSKMLAGRLQERYGLAKEEAEKEMHDFFRENDNSEKRDPEVATEGAPVTTEDLKIGMKP